MRLLETGKSHLASSSPKPFQNRAKNKTSFERKQATAKRTAYPQVDSNHNPVTADRNQIYSCQIVTQSSKTGLFRVANISQETVYGQNANTSGLNQTNAGSHQVCSVESRQPANLEPDVNQNQNNLEQSLANSESQQNLAFDQARQSNNEYLQFQKELNIFLNQSPIPSKSVNKKSFAQLYQDSLSLIKQFDLN